MTRLDSGAGTNARATGDQQPPGPTDPITLNTDADSLAALSALIEEYGDFFCFHSKNRNHQIYFLNRPDLLQHVLVSNHQNYTKGVGFERVRMLLGNGIIVSDGETWRRQRTLIQPGFSRSSITRLAERIKVRTLCLRDDWIELAQGDAIDITAATSHYALDIILRSIFSSDLAGMRDKEGGPLFAFLAEDRTRDLDTALRFRALRPHIEQCIDDRLSSGERPFDFLSAMMDARDKRSGEGMSKAQLVDEVSTLIVAGHETSAGTLNWAWYLISRHPQVEERLLDELQRLPPDEELSFDDVTGLDYTRWLLQETLRLYPPVWLFTRRAIAADRFGDTDIQPGSHVFISPYLLHRQETFWTEPEVFEPERFDPRRAGAEIKDAYIPFSLGARRCIGEYFAMVEMQFHIAIMARRFRLQALPEQTVEIDPAVNLRMKKNLQMSIQLRDRVEIS
jgi:cytochrome P450